MVTLLSVVLVLGLAGTVFFAYAPQIGATAKGQRLARVQGSPHFADGTFQNSIPTPMGFSAKEIPGLMWKMITGVKGQTPERTIQTQPFEAGAFQQLPDSQTAFTWFGHSSLLLRIDGKTLLFDPVFSPRASMFSFMGPKHFPYDRHMEAEALPFVDAVFISHDHYDHLDYETMKQLRSRVSQFFVPLGVGAHLEAWGIPAEQITEMDWWEEAAFDGLDLAFTPSRHFSGRGLSNRNTTLWGSWVIKGSSDKVFFSGDSGYTPEFANIGERHGPFDLAFIECGQYNELWSSIHMMPEESAQAGLDVKANVMVPIHWGKFSLALHTWEDPVARMTAEADRLGQPYLLPEVGQTVILGSDKPAKRWWEQF